MFAHDALDIEGQLPVRRFRRSGATRTVEQALDLVPDGVRVYVAPLMGTPTTLVAAMAAESERWQSIETTSDYLLEPLATFDEAVSGFTHTAVQPTRATAPLVERGLLRVVPGSSSQFAKLYGPGGALEIDVALVQVSLPGPDGRFSLGTNGAATPEIVRTAPVVIAEVNPAMPYVRGAVECDRHDFDALVDVEHDLLYLPPPPTDDVSSRIGALVAGLVPDGATIEYGIGAIPDAALSALSGRVGLGLHGGMLGDGVIDLIESGTMDGSQKDVDRGLHVVSAIIGGPRSIGWLHGRDDVVVVASNYSHGVPTLARHRRFVAINSAVEVALDGSVNAEAVGDRVVSGPGGQPDFAVGASAAEEGINIVALPATARRGTTSRIVESIGAGAPTTVSRTLADRVVTEFGVAELRGVDLVEREQRLRAICDPQLGVGG